LISLFQIPTNIDLLHAVQKSASFYKEEMLKMKALAVAQQQENEQRQKIEIEKKTYVEIQGSSIVT
jgi:hypothetical protein